MSTTAFQSIANFIDGEFLPAQGGGTLDNVEPATGRIYGDLPDSDERDVAHAVDAARAAFPAWRDRGALERARIMERIADIIDAHLDELAHAESIDNGKPVWLARSVDIPRAAANMRHFGGAMRYWASESHLTEGGVQGAKAINYTLRQPRGVAGCISPWNLPLYLFTWKIAPVLATGNTVVAKPSEITPMTAFMLGAMCAEAGLPPGVLNIVHGLGPKVGQAIVEHPAVSAISFTGGTTTGMKIAGTAAPMFKKMSLELGGKNPNIIFADADLDEALTMTVRSSFANQGQICLCGSRIYVERPVYDDFLAGLIERTRKLKPGDPLDESTAQGALVSQAHLEKVEACIAAARDEGATVECGGRRPTDLPERCRGGFFLEPTVLTGLGPACSANLEEIFGPVVTVQPFDHELEALGHANATQYGLSATVWTRDIDRALRLAEQIDAGTVWVNCWLLRDLRVPFGGTKWSGVGREGGEEALRFFTEAKNVCLRMHPGSMEDTP